MDQFYFKSNQVTSVPLYTDSEWKRTEESIKPIMKPPPGRVSSLSHLNSVSFNILANMNNLKKVFSMVEKGFSMAAGEFFLTFFGRFR